MLNKAIAWGYVQTHPVRGMKGLKEPPGRLRYLTPNEKARLLDTCASPPYLRPIVDLAMHTGMRRSKYLAMGGFNLRTIQQLLGHRDLRMTSRYAHLSADHLQQAVKSLDAVLGESSDQEMARPVT